MTGAHSQHRKGIVLVVAAAIAWSTAPFFTRLLPFDSWTILFWRGLFGGALIATILVLLQGRSGLQDFTRMEKSGWLVASYAVGGHHKAATHRSAVHWAAPGRGTPAAAKVRHGAYVFKVPRHTPLP